MTQKKWAWLVAVSYPSAKFGPIESKSLPVSDVMAAQWRLGAGLRIAMRVAGPGGRAAVSCPGAWWSDEGIVGKFSRRVENVVSANKSGFSGNDRISWRRNGGSACHSVPDRGGNRGRW